MRRDPRFYAMVALAGVLAFMVAILLASLSQHEVVINRSSAGWSRASIVVEVPDGATHARATITARQPGGEARPSIRDDAGGWWEGRRAEVSTTTKSRPVDDGMRQIRFSTDGYEPGAVGLEVEVTFTVH